jgi:cysteinyl-tRNA synthetase
MKPVYLYNSLSQTKEELKPLIPGKVSMYVCGPTVYGDVHVGNMRPVVVFDVLKRFLTYLGYDVTYVSNYTDIDDKIIEKAAQEAQSETIIANHYIQAYQDNVAAVHALLPDHTPRVTDHLDGMVHYIECLLKQGYAYEKNGNVYFRVNKIPSYGSLSHIDLDALNIGSRIEESPDKEHPHDFALWKKTEKGMSFPSSFGRGRPGWHTECIVMIHDVFQQPQIDIHGGGFDLKFPHHENELAQHKAHHDNTLASIWMHNGFINLNDEKMSKSTGSLILAKDFINQYGGNLLRYVLLATHYRMPVNFTSDILENAQHELQKIVETMRSLSIRLQRLNASLNGHNMDSTFLDALADDLNTSNALTVIQRYLKEANIALRDTHATQEVLLNAFFTIRTMMSILGLVVDDVLLSDDDKYLYDLYEQAKQRKDYAASDMYRQQLVDRGVFA